MNEKKNNKRNLKTPVEKHSTAAWANIESLKSDSNVTIPELSQVINAKKYVETNEK